MTRYLILGCLAVAMGGCGATAVLTPLPQDRVAVRYRIEQRADDGDWVPVQVGRTFRKNEQIRLRFLSNTAGTLYLLNGSGSTLHPVFPGRGGELEGYFGLGTRIPAHRVGLWPRSSEGSAMRFTGAAGTERFLLIYVPETLSRSRDMLAIPPGAEDWDFEAETTHVVSVPLGEILYHYLEVKTR